MSLSAAPIISEIMSDMDSMVKPLVTGLTNDSNLTPLTFDALWTKIMTIICTRMVEHIIADSVVTTTTVQPGSGTAPGTIS